MRHHHELPLTGSWNYVLTMRHHHTTIVELYPDQWGTTMRSHLEINGITSWPYQKSCLTNQRNIIMHAQLMPTSIINHPFMFHAKIIPNSPISSHDSPKTCIFTTFMLKIEKISQSCHQQQIYKKTARICVKSRSS